MKQLFRLLAFAPLFAAAQGKGIEFIHAANWQEVLQKAKAEKKLIFVDAYTTWCGPCRYLSTEIFPQPKVGEFYNDRFISVKLQLDTTAADNEYVRQWYADAGRMMHDMDIRVFPTLLFFDADGRPIHRVAGAGDAERILGYARTALDTSRRYYNVLARYNSGARDEQTLQALVRASVDAYQTEIGGKAFSELVHNANITVTRETAELAEALVQSTDDAAFHLLETNGARVDSLLGRPGAAENRIRYVLSQSLLKEAIRTKLGPEYTAYANAMRQRFGPITEEISARSVMNYYRSVSDWTRFAPATITFMKSFGSKLEPVELNDIAWTFFEHYTDKALLNEALAWSKKSLAAEDPNFYDTYANLLHKAGRTQEAIHWEEKGMTMVPEAEKASYKANIDKMKKGQKTW